MEDSLFYLLFFGAGSSIALGRIIDEISADKLLSTQKQFSVVS